MALLSLPDELLLLVSEHLASATDINALAQASHRLYNLCNSLLYQRAPRRGKESVLAWAALHSRLATAQKLLQEMTDDETPKDDSWAAALCYATYDANEAMIRLLLENGADINADCGKLSTPIQIAASQGPKQIVQLLLDSGADVDAPFRYRAGPVQAAKQAGDDEIVQLLLNSSKKNKAYAG